MSEVKVKTNIMCGACIEKVTPILDQVLGSGSWKVDTTDPRKVLSVNDASEEKVISAVQKAGYKAEKLG